MTVWEKAGIIAAMVIGVLEALIVECGRAVYERRVLTTPGVREGFDVARDELAGLTAAVGQPPGGDHEYQLAQHGGETRWLPTGFAGR
jgi:hypothetical protein